MTPDERTKARVAAEYEVVTRALRWRESHSAGKGWTHAHGMELELISACDALEQLRRDAFGRFVSINNEES